MQVTFICFIYPVLLLTYAGQAAFIYKYFDSDAVFHLSESIPNSKLCITLCYTHDDLFFSPVNRKFYLFCFYHSIFRESSACICGVIYICFSSWKSSNNHSRFFHNKPMSSARLLSQSKSCPYIKKNPGASLCSRSQLGVYGFEHSIYSWFA